jgi:ferredoxin-NADP reductase
MSSSSGMLAGLCFACLAAVNVVLVLEASRGGRSQKTRYRLMLAHRAGGYLFLIVFSVMAYFMSQRLIGLGLLNKPPIHLIVHVSLVLLLVPLLFLKVLIARRYKQSHSLLMPLGLSIFATTFVLVSLPALSELLVSVDPASAVPRIGVIFTVALCLFLFGLALRPRKKESIEDPLLVPGVLNEIKAKRPDGKSERSPMHLVLERVKQETHDTKTLRFMVPRERRFQAKPGQFLTFHWVIKGTRMTRSYTISSSPVHPEYVEITPKRIANGCVSGFLNDDVRLGLTVEASGPYGRFSFDETIHERIVLIAAGSGITPMIAILRYIKDKHLSTSVTLLYCVRTSRDIIFRAELEKLRESVPTFTYHVSLSQPEEDWTGHTGRFTREFVVENTTDPEIATFFLCGPSGFMENAREILTSLGVHQNRINQESFGEQKAPKVSTAQIVHRAVGNVEFLGSQKICELKPGLTLLEVAEGNGVQIPYGCRQGHCGTCATRVLCGSVRMETDDGLTDEQRDAGYVLPCVTKAEGKVVVAA